MRPSRVVWLVARLGLGVVLLVWLSRAGVIDWQAIPALARQPVPVTTAVVAMVAGILAMAARLCLLAAPLDVRVGFGASVRLQLIGTCFNVFMPGSAGGDLARLYLVLKDQKGRRAELAAILVFDRIVGLVAMLLVPLLAALLFPQVARSHPAIVAVLRWAALLAVLAAGAAVALWGPVGRAWAHRLLDRLPLGDVLRRAAVALRAYRAHPWTVASALALSLAATTLGLFTMVLLARAMGATGSTQVMLVLLPIGLLVNTVPLTPGGLGVGEVAMDRLFGLANLTGGAAAVIGWRLLLLLPATAGLLLYIQGRADFVAAASEPRQAGGPA